MEYHILINFSTKHFSGATIDGHNEETLYKALDKFIYKFLPFTYKSSSDIDYTLFENDGEKYACIFNHSGVSKCIDEGETTNPSATIDLTLTMKNAQIAEVFDLCGDEYLAQENTLKASLKGGNFILFRYK